MNGAYMGFTPNGDPAGLRTDNDADRYFLEGYRAFRAELGEPKSPYSGWQGRHWSRGWHVACMDYPFNAFPQDATP